MISVLLGTRCSRGQRARADPAELTRNVLASALDETSLDLGKNPHTTQSRTDAVAGREPQPASTMMSGPDRACATCGRRFARSTHLRRHEATHQEVAHHCPFCNKGFARRDVARRHSSSCAKKTEADAVCTARRGRKPKACRACVGSKLACDTKVPCGRCAARGLRCTYDGTRSISQEQPPFAEPTSHPKRSLFLSITDPEQSAHDILATEELGVESLRHGQRDQTCLSRLGIPSFLSGLPFLASKSSYEDPFLPTWGLSGADDDWDPDFSLLGVDSARGGLQARLNTLRSELTQLGRESRVEEPGAILYRHGTASYDGFFTEETVLQCISSFFRRMHWLGPIIHWPSFDPEKVALPLLLAISLAGVTHARPEDEVAGFRIAARAWFETAETFIFRHLQTILLSAQRHSKAGDTIQACQAALLIEVLQNSDHDCKTRRRVMNTRHPTLVAAIRQLGFVGRQHARGVTSPGWDHFIQAESIIRLVTWTFITDSLLSLFCNQPPSMSVSEMVGDGPCDDVLWDATDEDDFRRQWRSQMSAWRPPSVRQLVEGLMNDIWSAASEECYSRLTADQLHIVLWGKFSSCLSRFSCTSVN